MDLYDLVSSLFPNLSWEREEVSNIYWGEPRGRCTLGELWEWNKEAAHEYILYVAADMFAAPSLSKNDVQDAFLSRRLLGECAGRVLATMRMGSENLATALYRRFDKLRPDLDFVVQHVITLHTTGVTPQEWSADWEWVKAVLGLPMVDRSGGIYPSLRQLWAVAPDQVRQYLAWYAQAGLFSTIQEYATAIHYIEPFMTWLYEHGLQYPSFRYFYPYAAHAVAVRGEELLMPRAAWEISPTGFGWGYVGSGADALAYTLIEAVYDDDMAARLHQQYKRDVIAKLPERGWVITEIDVKTWVLAHV